jgi:hypothetical protein
MPVHSKATECKLLCDNPSRMAHPQCCNWHVFPHTTVWRSCRIYGPQLGGPRTQQERCCVGRPLASGKRSYLAVYSCVCNGPLRAPSAVPSG